MLMEVPVGSMQSNQMIHMMKIPQWIIVFRENLVLAHRIRHDEQRCNGKNITRTQCNKILAPADHSYIPDAAERIRQLQ